MATIKGQNLRVLAGVDLANLKCIAAATTCTVHVAAEVQEDMSKDTEDDWIINEVAGLSWDVSAEAIVNDADAGAHTADSLVVGAVYKLRFSRTAGASGEQNRDTVDTLLTVTGDAILSDMQQVATNKEFATVRLQFTGHGDLTQYAEE